MIRPRSRSWGGRLRPLLFGATFGITSRSLTTGTGSSHRWRLVTAVEGRRDHPAIGVKRGLGGVDAPVTLLVVVEPDHRRDPGHLFGDGAEEGFFDPCGLVAAGFARGGLGDDHRLCAQRRDRGVRGGEDLREGFPRFATRRSPVVAVERHVVDPFVSREELGEGAPAVVDVGRPDPLDVVGALLAEDRDDMAPGFDVTARGVAFLAGPPVAARQVHLVGEAQHHRDAQPPDLIGFPAEVFVVPAFRDFGERGDAVARVGLERDHRRHAACLQGGDLAGVEERPGHVAKEQQDVRPAADHRRVAVEFAGVPGEIGAELDRGLRRGGDRTARRQQQRRAERNGRDDKAGPLAGWRGHPNLSALPRWVAAMSRRFWTLV